MLNQLPKKVMILLDHSNKWRQWLEIMKGMATLGDIWDVINPLGDKDNNKAYKNPRLQYDCWPHNLLVKPKFPVLEHVNLEKTALSKLNADKKEDYKLLKDLYWTKYQMYNQRMETMKVVHRHIFETVDAQFHE